ncbi:MAG TPA: TlpA disulfide reductase family protein [Polyangiaceae bacterium]
MTKPSETSRSGLTVLLVLGAAALVGLLALPRFGKDALIGSEPRDFALPRLAAAGAPESAVRLSDFSGKAVILEFWASWCGPCREQGPIVDRLAQSLAGRGLAALGILSGDEPEAARRFLASHPLGYPSVVDEQRDAARAFGVQALPTLVVLDRAGRVVAVRRRFVPEAELRGIVEAALEN